MNRTVWILFSINILMVISMRAHPTDWITLKHRKTQNSKHKIYINLTLSNKSKRCQMSNLKCMNSTISKQVFKPFRKLETFVWQISMIRNSDAKKTRNYIKYESDPECTPIKMKWCQNTKHMYKEIGSSHCFVHHAPLFSRKLHHCLWFSFDTSSVCMNVCVYIYICVLFLMHF